MQMTNVHLVIMTWHHLEEKLEQLLSYQDGHKDILHLLWHKINIISGGFIYYKGDSKTSVLQLAFYPRCAIVLFALQLFNFICILAFGQ